MKRFNEGTNIVTTATFVDADGAAMLPSSVHYQLRDSRGSVVIGWTEVTPALTVDIDIGAQYVALVNGRRTDWQELTVVANKDTEHQIPVVYRWTVDELTAIE